MWKSNFLLENDHKGGKDDDEVGLNCRSERFHAIIIQIQIEGIIKAVIDVYNRSKITGTAVNGFLWLTCVLCRL